LAAAKEDFAPLAKEPSAYVACKHLQGNGTTLSGIRYPHAVRHRISLNGEAAMAKEPKKLDALDRELTPEEQGKKARSFQT
jgi:hypothetical protein